MKRLLDPIFPKEEAIRGDRVDDVHDPSDEGGDEKEETKNVENERNGLHAVGAVVDDAIDQPDDRNKDGEEDFGDLWQTVESLIEFHAYCTSFDFLYHIR